MIFFIVIGLFCFKGSQQKRGLYYLKIKFPFFILFENQHKKIVCLSLSSQWSISIIWRRHQYHTDEWLQILTYVRHSWRLSIEGSLEGQICADTEHPFIMVNTETCYRALSSEAFISCFNDLALSRPEFEHTTSVVVY